MYICFSGVPGFELYKAAGDCYVDGGFFSDARDDLCGTAKRRKVFPENPGDRGDVLGFFEEFFLDNCYSMKLYNSLERFLSDFPNCIFIVDRIPEPDKPGIPFTRPVKGAAVHVPAR